MENMNITFLIYFLEEQIFESSFNYQSEIREKIEICRKRILCIYAWENKDDREKNRRLVVRGILSCKLCKQIQIFVNNSEIEIISQIAKKSFSIFTNFDIGNK